MTQGTKIEILDARTRFYLLQADACGTDAGKAVLPNVRERLKGSEVAWRAMAGLSASQVESHRKEIADVAADRAATVIPSI